MSKGRTIASSVILALLIGLCGACGGTSKSFTAAQKERAAQEKADAAAQAKAVAKREAAARRRAQQARRKAAIAARLRENARRAQQNATSTTRPTTTTTPTKPTPTTAPTTVPTTPSTPTTPPAADPQADLVVIQQAFERLNAAFRASVAAGIAHSETLNYWVDAGVYTARQCAAFEAAQGGGVIRESLTVQPSTFRADPGWVDPIVGSKPAGRVYRLVATNVQTLVTSGEQRTVSAPLHVTIRPDGRALLFLRCR